MFTQRPTSYLCLRLRRPLRAREPAKVVKTRKKKVRNLSKRFARVVAAKKKKNEEILALQQSFPKFQMRDSKMPLLSFLIW